MSCEIYYMLVSVLEPHVWCLDYYNWASEDDTVEPTLPEQIIVSLVQ